jgi:hypothetical protein
VPVNPLPEPVRARATTGTGRAFKHAFASHGMNATATEINSSELPFTEATRWRCNCRGHDETQEAEILSIFLRSFSSNLIIEVQ